MVPLILNRKQSGMLDVMRVFAAVWVYFVHLDQWTKLLPGWIKPFAWKGAYGVTIFFILSGILVFRSGCANTVKDYFIKRVARIVPLYYSLLVGLIIINGWLMPRLAEDAMHLGWLRYFTFSQMILPSYNFGAWNNLFGLWTMSSFAVFYLFVPVLVRTIKKLWHAGALLFLLLLCAQYCGKILGAVPGLDQYNEFESYVLLSPLNNLWMFGLGVFLYFALLEKRVPAAFGGLAGAMIVFQDMRPQLLIGCVILLLLWKPVPLGPLTRFFHECSHCTFALYLAHPVVISTLSYMMVWYNWTPQFDYYLMLTVPFVLSVAAYYLVERPAARFIVKPCQIKKL